MYPFSPDRPAASSAAQILFSMFRVHYDSEGPKRMLDIGFSYASDASIRAPARDDPVFSFPLPSVLVHLLAGLPHDQCLSDVREHMLGCILSKHLLRLDTDSCTSQNRSFLQAFVSLLRDLPPLHRPTILLLARHYPAFGIPEDFKPDFPRVLCAPSIQAQNLSFGSAHGISLLPNTALFDIILRLLRDHSTVRTAYFEPKMILQPRMSAAVTEFNDRIAAFPLHLDEWPRWYDSLGLFKP